MLPIKIMEERNIHEYKGGSKKINFNHHHDFTYNIIHVSSKNFRTTLINCQGGTAISHATFIQKQILVTSDGLIA